MSQSETVSQGPDVQDNLQIQKDAAVKKVWVYLLLTVATALSILLWINHGAVFALGFIFLEVQFLLVISTIGMSSAVLEQISQMLTLLTQGDEVDFHYQRKPTTAEEAEAKLSEVVEKTAKAAGVKP